MKTHKILMILALLVIAIGVPLAFINMWSVCLINGLFFGIMISSTISLFNERYRNKRKYKFSNYRNLDN